MSRYEGIMEFVQSALMVFIAALCLSVPVGMGGMAWAANASSNHQDKSKSDLENVRTEAAKALYEAQNAMAKADELMRAAQKQKEESKAKEQDALQTMVSAGYYPSDITLTTESGKVHAVFSHRKHLTREKLRCTECHPKIFLMNTDKESTAKGFTMESMKNGRYCGTCHNGNKAFSVEDLATCKRCHPKQL